MHDLLKGKQANDKTIDNLGRHLCPKVVMAGSAEVGLLDIDASNVRY